MIKIAENGNTIIQTVTGAGAGGRDQWTVYPYVTEDPTLQKFSPQDQEKIKQLNITGFRDSTDFSGRKMTADIAGAIASLVGRLSKDRNKDLGLVADRIAVEPGGETARILDEKYEIKAIDPEVIATGEAKG